MYGQLFLSKNGTKDNGTWFEILKGFTPKALESGVERLKNLAANGKFMEFPPSCLQFKGLCMAFYEELRLPKIMDAYREILRIGLNEAPRWSHPVIGFISQKMPDEFFMIEQEGLAFAIFKDVYSQVCDLIKQGHELKTSTSNQFKIRRIPNKDIAHTHLLRMKQIIGA